MGEDLRTVKSKKAIEGALLSLLEITPFSKITMTNIAEKAMVNRNTIYLHYQSKEDIVVSIISDQFKKTFSEINPDEMFPKYLNRHHLKKAFIEVLNTINDSIDLYRLALMDESLVGYVNILLVNIKKKILEFLKPTKKNVLGVEYIVNGSFGVISRWIIYATGEIDEIADLLADFNLSEFRKLNRI